jgi:hypothetical protein
VSDPREELRVALNPAHEAERACIAALDGGASVHASSETVFRDHLLTIYKRREEHLERLGARTIGSDDFIERLSAADERLHIASVDDDEWHFVVFMDSERRVVSTWGVETGLGDRAAGD